MTMLKTHGLWREENGGRYAGPVFQECPHLCLFTQLRSRKRKGVAAGWCQLFGKLVAFLGGDERSGDALQGILTKTGAYDPVFAEQLLRVYRERGRALGLKWGPINGPIYGFYGTDWSEEKKEEFRRDMSERKTKEWQDKTPADRDARGVAMSKAKIDARTKLTRAERASKCKSGLLVPEDAACFKCGCGLRDAGCVEFYYAKSGKIEVRTKCGGADGVASCGKVLCISKFSKRQELCANVAPDVFALFEQELAAAMRMYPQSAVRHPKCRRWTCDDKVAFRLGYLLHGMSWVSIGREVFNYDPICRNSSSRFRMFCSKEFKRINKAQMKVLKGIKMAAMPNAVVRFSADGTVNIDEKVLQAHTTPKQREALYG